MTQWGRKENYRWPSDKPLWTIGAFIAGLLAILATVVYQYNIQWTPLQRYWFPKYLKTYVMAGLSIKDSEYTVLEVETSKHQRRLAVESDVTPWDGPLPQGYTIPLRISDAAAKQGLRPVVSKGRYNNLALQQYIRRWIYQDQSFADFLHWPLISGAVVFVCVLSFGIPRDLEARRIRKYGQRTQGPELVTAAKFNSQNHSDGVGFVTQERRTFG